MMIRKKLSRIALGLLVCLFLGAAASNGIAQSQAPGSAPTLYKRVGGYEAIAAVSDDFIGRLASDKQLARFLVGLSADSQKKLRQHVVDQLWRSDWRAMHLHWSQHEGFPCRARHYRRGLAVDGKTFGSNPG
jgi:Bacterial-like globin